MMSASGAYQRRRCFLAMTNGLVSMRYRQESEV